MGPFIVKPRSRQNEIDRIVGVLTAAAERGGDSWLPDQVRRRLHAGSFAQSGRYSRTYTHIHCRTCGWDSEGPLVDMNNVNYGEAARQHRMQWRIHRAEHAIDDGVVIP